MLVDTPGFGAVGGGRANVPTKRAERRRGIVAADAGRGCARATADCALSQGCAAGRGSINKITCRPGAEESGAEPRTTGRRLYRFREKGTNVAES